MPEMVYSFLERASRKRGSLTLAGDAGSLSNRTLTGYAREIGEHLLDALVLEGGFKGVLGIFHVYIVPY